MESLSAALKHRMNYLTQKQGTISSNIANVNTPDYRAQKLDFKSLVTQQTGAPTVTHAKHMSGSNAAFGGHAMSYDTENPKHNGNTVRIDEQMVQMNDLQLQYRLATSLYSKHAAMQRMALGSGAGG